jgi:hypothetical protein
MLTKLYRTIRRKIFGTPKWNFSSEAPIEYAFSFDGEDYFMFSNPLSIPWQRGFVSLAYYEEMNMRMTREFMESWVSAFEEKLAKERISLSDIVKHVGIIRDRLTWVVEPMTLYKLASVVFFTRSENPAKYDFIYNQKKIQSWQRDDCMLDFFLQGPLQILLPHLKLSPENISSYLSPVTKISKMQISELQKELSHMKSSDESVKRMSSEIQILERLISKL